jgi:uncharacterized protein (DUF433 family)
MASVTCPHCTKSVNVPDGMGGKQMRCPGCRKVFPIPEPVGAKAGGGPPPIPLAGGPAHRPPAPAAAHAAAKVPVKPSGPSNQGLAPKPAPVPPPPKPSGPSNAGLAPRPAPAPAPVQPGPPLVPRPSNQGLPAKPGPLPIPTLTYPHVEKPAGQPARLQRVPGIRVSQIVMDYLAFGWSPEEMCRQHPHLAPADVHSAMAYYYDNRPEIEQEIMNELNQVGQDQAKAQPSPALLKMRTP